jgi:phosphoribosyl-AMP cyclohydrolase
MSLIDDIRFDDDGLTPAAVTDFESGRLLVLCYLDRQALEQTLKDGRVHLYRRSKGEVQMKGATSGHVQRVREIRTNCESNSLEIRVDQEVAACHAGYFSCYYRRWNADTGAWEVADERRFDPDQVYPSDSVSAASGLTSSS